MKPALRTVPDEPTSRSLWKGNPEWVGDQSVVFDREAKRRADDADVHVQCRESSHLGSCQ